MNESTAGVLDLGHHVQQNISTRLKGREKGKVLHSGTCTLNTSLNVGMSFECNRNFSNHNKLPQSFENVLYVE